MRPTTPGILLLLLVLAALAAPVAAGQTQQGPGALWDAYPLEPATPTPAPATPTPPAAATPVPAEPPAAAPEPSGDDGVPIWAMIVGALAIIVVGGGVGIFTVARLRERQEDAIDARPAPTREAAPARDPMSVATVAPAPAPARAAAPARRAAPPDPVPAPAPAAPAAPVTAAPPAPAPAPAPAVARAMEADDLELAELAAEYLWTVATGTRRPVVDLAARRSLRVGRTREMLGRARARGILAGAGRGRPGGALTEKGRRLLEAGSASTHAPARQEDAPPPAEATPDTTTAAPPRLRLAEEEEGHDAPGPRAGDGVVLADGDAAARAFTVLEGGGRRLS